MKKAALTISIILMTLLSAFVSKAGNSQFPKDYTIDEAAFDDQSAENGIVIGTWLPSEDKTSYTVVLYKGTTKVFNKRVSDPKIDFSAALVSKKGGTGQYTFTVYPTKSTDPELLITSEPLEVTTTILSALKAKIAKDKKAAIAARGGGWEKGPGNLWIYYDKEGNQVKGKWLEYNGHKYYLDKSGIMLTGWQAINSVYYYLEPKGSNGYPLGACWVNTTTPDGHQVDETGARLDVTGKQETVKVSKVLATISLGIKETQEPGQYTKITSITCGSGELSDFVYSSDPNTWNFDVIGKVDFRGKITNGYVINDTTKLSCARANGVSMLAHTKESFHAELRYSPKYVLEEPKDFYITEGFVLKWGKVDKASSYEVKVVIATVTESETEDGEIVEKTSTNTVTLKPEVNFVDLAASQIYDDTDVRSITVGAVGADTKKFISSSQYKITDFKEFVATRTLNGTLTIDTKGLKYQDEMGQVPEEWTQIFGDWYIFKPNGYARTGWYKDEEELWYYLGTDGKLQTGQVTLEDGVTYNLNDGSNEELPLGAWIH